MKEVVTCREMKLLDTQTIETAGVPSCVLMERAALAVVDVLEQILEREERVLVVCGNGNNGGDGVAIARILHTRGVCAEIFLVDKDGRRTKETELQLKIADSYKVPKVNNPVWGEYTTIVDAIFGIGLTRPVEGRCFDIIREMNAARAKKVAVDIPSGVNGDNGHEMGIAFLADITVTFAFRKRGLCFYPGRMYGGEILVADVGIYQEPKPQKVACCLEAEDLEELPARKPYGNKGTFGKVLLVAGSEGMCGAAYLSAEAALKAGAGMVKIQTVEANRVPLQVLLPEAMISCDFDEEENQRLLDWCDVLVIGPGLGMRPESGARAHWFLTHACTAGKPVILDADGLNLLAAHREWMEYLGPNVVVTPHIGEMSRLCQKTIREIQNAMAETAAEYVEKTGTVCVLKDACTVVAAPGGDMYLNLEGNAGMATAGSGDVLSGILAAVFCMYLSAEEEPDNGRKAALGVLLHSVCGDAAAARYGMQAMTARNIVESLSEILQ